MQTLNIKYTFHRKALHKVTQSSSCCPSHLCSPQPLPASSQETMGTYSNPDSTARKAATTKTAPHNMTVTEQEAQSRETMSCSTMSVWERRGKCEKGAFCISKQPWSIPAISMFFLYLLYPVFLGPNSITRLFHKSPPELGTPNETIINIHD